MSVVNGKFVIHAVHERDVERFWKGLELKDVEKCFMCGCDVTWKSVGAFSSWDGEVVVVCKDLKCFVGFQAMRIQRRMGMVAS